MPPYAIIFFEFYVNHFNNRANIRCVFHTDSSELICVKHWAQSLLITRLHKCQDFQVDFLYALGSALGFPFVCSVIWGATFSGVPFPLTPRKVQPLKALVQDEKTEFGDSQDIFIPFLCILGHSSVCLAQIWMWFYLLQDNPLLSLHP